MQINLFVPCLVETVVPEVGEATARVLTRAGCAVSVPPGQTCCGQPVYKTGNLAQARQLAARYVRLFDQGTVVSPSASCVAMVRRYPDLLAHDPALAAKARDLAGRIFELSEFLVNVLGTTDLGACLNARAAYHDSCQVGRVLGLHDEPRTLLAAVRGLTVLELERPDACCGFGGAFSVQFPDASDRILADKIEDILAQEPDIVVSAEVSCLLNIRSGLEHAGSPVRALHLAQVLDQGMDTREAAS